MKLVYFRIENDAQCERALASWAKTHGIEYIQEPVRIQAGGTVIETKRIIFRTRTGT